jgi:hypothetical protein
MNGQWMGKYTGTSEGRLMINIDDRGSHFEGVAYLRPSEKGIPWTGADFKTANKDRQFQFTTDNLWAIHARTANSASADDMKEYPGLTTSNRAEVTGRWDEGHLELSWKTDIGTFGSTDLRRSQATEPSDLQAIRMGWREFKEYVASLAGTPSVPGPKRTMAAKDHVSSLRSG